MIADDIYKDMQPQDITVRLPDIIQVKQMRFRFDSAADNKLTLVELMLKHADALRKEYTR